MIYGLFINEMIQKRMNEKIMKKNKIIRKRMEKRRMYIFIDITVLGCYKL